MTAEYICYTESIGPGSKESGRQVCQYLIWRSQGPPHEQGVAGRQAPLQLYSLATPERRKVYHHPRRRCSRLGTEGAEYDAFPGYAST